MSRWFDKAEREARRNGDTDRSGSGLDGWHGPAFARGSPLIDAAPLIVIDGGVVDVNGAAPGAYFGLGPD